MQSLHTMQNENDEVSMVERRLEFMELDKKRSMAIRAIKPFIERELPKGLDLFYAKLRTVPELSRFFSSDHHMAQAKEAQIGHWANISSGDFGADYAKKVRRIGSVHARIGLEPTWYIGGYAMVTEYLVSALIKEAFPQGAFASKKTAKAEALAETVGGLLKAVFLDMDLAISVYLEEAERAKKNAQEEAIAAEQESVCDVFGNALEALANKDMTCKVEVTLPPAYQEMTTTFNRVVKDLAETIIDIKSSATDVQSNTLQIRHSSDDLARRTEQQAASVEQTAAALEEITTAVADASKRAEEAGVMVSATRKNAELSGAVVKDAVTAMQAIEMSSTQIANIIGVIDEIAFQTNLLALNAGVEAARAGEAGKGFAVVAQEVRELAQRSATAAKEINGLINSSGEQVRQGVILVGRTGESLAEIVSQVQEVSKNVSAIVESSREQAAGLREINTAVNSMDQGTQQNAAMVEETNATTGDLVETVNAITSKLDCFKLPINTVHTILPDNAVAVHTTKSGMPPLPVRAPEPSSQSERTSRSWEEF